MEHHYLSSSRTSSTTPEHCLDLLWIKHKPPIIPPILRLFLLSHQIFKYDVCYISEVNRICAVQYNVVDAEERQKFSEKVIVLLLIVDAIEGADIMVRAAKKVDGG
ncbi:unnamed protein product [Lactuca virosa]|uniref:Uncharacterized protein n=1 Tax=Lactuca virosa TaxID=75947 RepID=A0AAU9MHY5_9ASTR|nr:unnamed protein product [Lactuca virosa]